MIAVLVSLSLPKYLSGLLSVPTPLWGFGTLDSRSLLIWHRCMALDPTTVEEVVWERAVRSLVGIYSCFTWALCLRSDPCSLLLPDLYCSYACAWPHTPLSQTPTWFGCGLASALQTCQQSGLLLLIAATRPALLLFFRYCKSVPLLMKPLPALLPGSPSLMEQPVLAAPCWFSWTFLTPEPSTKEPGLWAVQNLSPTSQSVFRVLTAFLNP